MSWLFGLIGWGGAGALLVAVLAFGWVASKKVLLILGGIVAAALLAWGVRGYAQASALQVKLDAQVVATAKVEGERDTFKGERDTARGERDTALAAAKEASDSVAALETAAKKRALQAEKDRKLAAQRAHEAQQRAKAQLAAPPSVPGDDFASALDRARRWLASLEKTE